MNGLERSRSRSEVPAPCSTRALANSKINEGGRSQKLMLLSRGKAISGAPICTGTR
jgi:hypothetical protein